jgi:uncharacterized protein (DUF362 family)
MAYTPNAYGSVDRQLRRREFLKGLTCLGAFALYASLVPACVRENRVFAPKEGPMTKVSLVRTGDRADGVARAIALLDSNPVQGKPVILKPNFNSAHTTPGSTHIDTLRALVSNLQGMGAGKITLAERSGPGDSTQTVMEKKGIPDLARELGFDILNMQEMDESGWVLVRPPDSHWENGFLFPRIYSEAECIVQTCCLKTHAYGGHFTMSLKCSVGMVPGGSPYMRELHSSQYQREMIAEINTAYATDLVVMDGVDAFVDGGPAQGTLAKANVMLASSDRVAIDAVGVATLRLLGTTPDVSRGTVFEQDQIARAAKLGVGVASADQIELVTGDAESKNFADNVRERLIAA